MDEEFVKMIALDLQPFLLLRMKDLEFTQRHLIHLIHSSKQADHFSNTFATDIQISLFFVENAALQIQFACASDNASNIKAALQKAGWRHLPCFAHTINLIVREGLKHVQWVVAKVKTIVAHFHRTTTASEHFRALRDRWALKS